MSSMKLVLASLLVSGYGCVGMYTPKENSGFDPENPKYAPPLFEDYVAAIVNDQTEYPVVTIPRSLRLDAPRKLESSARAVGFTLASIDESKICVVGETPPTVRDRPAQEIATENLTNINDHHFSFRGITSLAAERGRPLFPVPDGATSLDSAEVVGDEIRDVDNTDRGTIERRRVVTWRLCGPRPKITDATRFLAITAHFLDTPEYQSELDTRGHRDPALEAANQRERRKPDLLLLVAITDGAVDLNN